MERKDESNCWHSLCISVLLVVTCSSGGRCMQKKQVLGAAHTACLHDTAKLIKVQKFGIRIKSMCSADSPLGFDVQLYISILILSEEFCFSGRVSLCIPGWLELTLWTTIFSNSQRGPPTYASQVLGCLAPRSTSYQMV